MHLNLQHNQQKILLLSFLSPELCNYNTQSVSTTKVKSNCKHHTLVVDSGLLHSSSVQICISMASGYTGISSLQRNFSSLFFFHWKKQAETSCSGWHQHVQFRHWEPAFGACCRIHLPILLVLGTNVSYRKHKWS